MLHGEKLNITVLNRIVITETQKSATSLNSGIFVYIYQQEKPILNPCTINGSLLEQSYIKLDNSNNLKIELVTQTTRMI